MNTKKRDAQVFRQEDVHFVSLLDKIRQGDQVGNAAARQLAELCSRPLPDVNGVKATEL